MRRFERRSTRPIPPPDATRGLMPDAAEPGADLHGALAALAALLDAVLAPE